MAAFDYDKSSINTRHWLNVASVDASIPKIKPKLKWEKGYALRTTSTEGQEACKRERASLVIQQRKGNSMAAIECTQGCEVIVVWWAFAAEQGKDTGYVESRQKLGLASVQNFSCTEPPCSDLQSPHILSANFTHQLISNIFFICSGKSHNKKTKNPEMGRSDTILVGFLHFVF